MLDSFEDKDLMQFTGVLDKNGKEIYEGDFVEGGSMRCPVAWDNGRAMFFIDSGICCTDFNHYEARVFEVIGNIHENPELIEK